MDQETEIPERLQLVQKLTNDNATLRDWVKSLQEGKRGLEARNADWISTRDRLPDSGEWVWVVINGVVQRQACYLNSSDKWWEWCDGAIDVAPLDVVTHWTHLPLPPSSA